MKLERCPCCKGRAYFADMPVNDMLLWQVICEQCGMATAYDEDKLFCRDRWNLRQERSNLKTWVTALGALAPFLTIVFFLAGILTGASLQH